MRRSNPLSLTLGFAMLIAPIAVAETPATQPSGSHCKPTELAPKGTELSDERAPLFHNMGSYHCPITTTSAEAQQFFDQGIRLYYGFNHKEAIRSFRHAARLDEKCAMAWWGVAIAYGPNINAPMVLEDVPTAWDALQKARALMPNASEKERALIEALSKRYVEEPLEDRTALDASYADAMRQVHQQYPNDNEVAVLLAEALMDTMPWEYWTEDKQPKPATKEILAALEAVIGRDPMHPGAHHLYIHAVEAGPTPEKGLASADALRFLVPGAGHLVHMPAHIYLRLGMYPEASRSNEEAILADESYVSQCRAQGMYPLMYYPHNQHFLWYSMMMEGRSREALLTAKKMVGQLTDKHVELNRLLPALIYTHVRFNRWDDVVKEPKPEEKHPFAQAIWHYGQGLAKAATGKFAEASDDLKFVTAMAESDKGKEMEVVGFFGQRQLQIAAETLAGEIASRQNQHDVAIAHLRKAVEIQDNMPYMEPPYWYYPARHTLGIALLRAGKWEESEQVFREDLKINPANGWALGGLAESLRKQGRHEAASEVDMHRFQAWRRADIDPLPKDLMAARY